MIGSREASPVFVRRINTPPGAPWDQYRAAKLDGEFGAPLPLDQIAMGLKRLEPWKPRKTGRFAVAYVRRSELGARRAITAKVDDQTVVFSVGSYGPRTMLTDPRLGLVIIGLAAAISMGLAVSKSWRARTYNEAALARLERAAGRVSQQALRRQQEASDARLLANVKADGRSFADLGRDLAWLGTARKPSATIRTVHWDGGVLDITVSGPDRPVVGSERPVEIGPREDGLGHWRIGAATAPVMNGGVARPSVVTTPQEADPAASSKR